MKPVRPHPAKFSMLAKLMCFLLVIGSLMPFAAGGGNHVYAAPPPYSPIPEVAPAYTGPLTWTDYTTPSAQGSNPYLPFFMDMDDHDNVYVTKMHIMYGMGNPSTGKVEMISDHGQTVTDITYDAEILFPIGIAVDGDGNVYVSDNSKNGNIDGNVARILMLPQGTESWVDITHGETLNYALGLAADRHGNVYAVDGSMLTNDTTTPRILMLPNGGSSWVEITGSPSPFQNPIDIAVDGEGNVFVSDLPYGGPTAGSIYKLPAGDIAWTNVAPATVSGGMPFLAFGIHVDPFDNLYTMSLFNGMVMKLGYDEGPNDWTDIQPMSNPQYGFSSYDVAADSYGYLYSTNFVYSNVTKLMATIIYNGHGNTGGTVPTDTYGYHPNEIATVSGNTGNLAKSGHVFGGWNSAADGSGTAYDPGDTINMTESVTLYAVWTPVTSISYNGNGNTGGDVPVDDAQYTPGATAVVSGNTGDLVRAGYSFDGWNTAADGSGTAYAPDDTIDLTQSVTLYAVWNPVPSYTVSYQAAAGGTLVGAASESVYNGSSPAAVPTATADSGYTFIGWSSDGGTTLLSDVQLAAAIVTSNIVYTAYFHPIVTLVTIDLDRDSYSLRRGATHQTVVTAAFSDLSSAALSSGVSYSSNNTDVATVDNTGLITARAAGQAVITAEYEGRQSQATVTVSSSSNPTPVTEPVNSTVEIIVDGVKQDQLATAKQGTVDGRSAVTVELDNKKVIDKLEQEDSKLVTIPVSGNSPVIVGQLNGSLVKAMESKDAQIQIVTEKAVYTLPAAQIHIDDISAQVGSEAKLEDIMVTIQISESSDETASRAQSAAERNRFEMVVQPVDFEISASYGSQTVQADKFNSYVGRMIALPEGMDSEDITTGVVLTANGELFHVPTTVVEQDGKMYALINSLTNSTYSVIYNPREMTDIDGHWAKADVNDMSSRLVIQGVTATEFRPDASITRAEYAAIITRALGIQDAPYEGSFTDVGASGWYAGAVQAAVNYKLFDGYEDGTFRPDQRISRQEATVVLHRAMRIAKLHSELSDSEVTRVLSAFTDGSDAASWARTSLAAAISLDLMNGRGDKLDLGSNLTRAETAALVRRFLQAANLINN